jgi:XTP/dITP diphosphohydrolase
MANEDFCVRGECRGVVLHEEKGEGGFGYDPLFFIEEYGKTFGELSADVKNKISHRAVATELFAKKFCLELDI